METQERLSLKDLAERIFKSRKHIYNLVEAGMPREKDGSFVWGEVWEWWNTRNEARNLVIQADPEGYAAAELRKMKADARWKEVKTAQLEDRVVEVAYVQQATERIFGNCRNRILGLPSKLTPQLIGQTSRANIFKILSDETHQCCMDLVQAVLKSVDVVPADKRN